MLQETRKEIVDRLLRFVREPDDSDARAIAEDLCAQAVFSIWLAHPFTEFVMPVDTQLVTVAGQPLYVLPTHFGRVARKDGIVRNLTTGARIYPRRSDDLENSHPEIGGALDTTTQDPTEYTISGKVGVAVQVASTGEALEALSSSAADTDVYLEIEGLDSTGQWNTTQVLLTGVTPVALGTWTYVGPLAKSYGADTTPATALTSSRGTVTIRKVSGAVTRQTLLPFESSREQYQMRFYHTPGSVQTIGVPTIRLPRRIFQDADSLPAMWGPAVFEFMELEYRVNTGQLSRQAALELPRRELDRLIGYDNELKPAARMAKRAFMGGQ